MSDLEPASTERPDDDGRIKLSTAISMKRIADALDRLIPMPVEKTNCTGCGLPDAQCDCCPF